MDLIPFHSKDSDAKEQSTLGAIAGHPKCQAGVFGQVDRSAAVEKLAICGY